jgi:2-haloacid dehalogenase
MFCNGAFDMAERGSGLPTGAFDRVTTLTFDVFGTVLDLGGSLTPPLAQLLAKKGAADAANQVWARWRDRQRIEQYQDTLLMMGHSGYTEAARRALLYSLRQFGVPFNDDDVAELMAVWTELNPFDDCLVGLERLKARFRLVVLSNGERDFLEHLVRNRIRFPFDEIVSVDEVGVFKPHPAVYRRAALRCRCEPHELMLISSNSFDVMGARACGHRGAWVDRYGLPFEETPYRPDLVVKDFTELADRLLG